jgi:hypothetical protein
MVPKLVKKACDWGGAKDLGEVWINFARKLGLGEDVSKLRITWDPVKLMDTLLLALADKVEAAFNVARLAGEFAILGNLDCGFNVNH